MNSSRSFWLISICFFLSGVAALVYEAAWSQQFALVFGTSELAVATVLAAYMAGLMAGALVAGRLLPRIRRPVLVYAVLELGIAVTALLVPAALAMAGRVQLLLLGGLDLPPDAGSLGSALFYLLSAFVILLLPTGLMGATLPFLARHAVRAEGEIGLRVGLLHTANTIGAAGGALVAAFFLLPALGLTGTVLVAAALNVLVFFAAVLLAKESAKHESAQIAGAADGPPATPSTEVEVEAVPAAASTSPELTSPELTSPELTPPEQSSPPPGGNKVLSADAFWVLPLVLVSGAVALGWEVLWTRLLSHLLGGSLYAFGTMLFTFLVGLGLGSGIAALWAKSQARARSGLVLAQLGVGLGSWLTFALANHFPGRFPNPLATGELGTGVLLAAAALLPGALCMGAVFPCAVRLAAGSASGAGAATARVYGWNTCGAIVGALGTGFVLLPWLRIAGVAVAAIAISLVLALAASLYGRQRWRPGIVLASAALALLALRPPQTPWEVLRSSPLSSQGPLAGEVDYYEVGRSSTVLLLQRDGSWRLTTNGLPESVVRPPGARVGRYTVSRWLSKLPVAIRPQIDSMMIIGLGAGITPASVPPSVAEVHVVELEHEVVAANQHLAEVRNEDPLSDPRLQMHLNDARTALMLSPRRFDAIVSQPSHPWTAGASHLYTRELFALAKERLNPEGVFLQWIGLPFVDSELLRSLLATLNDVFPYVEVYQPPPGGAALFLCSQSPLDVPPDLDPLQASGAELWRQMGILTREDLLAARLLDHEGSRQLAAGAALVTDGRNLLQTRAPKVLHRALGMVGLRQMASEYSVHNQLPEGADALYVLRRLVANRRFDEASRLADRLAPSLVPVADALLNIANRRQRQGLQQMGAILRQPQADPRAKDAAVHELVRWRLRGRARTPLPPVLQQAVADRPVARALLEGHRRLALRDVPAVRELDPVLASASPHHGLYTEATRLRIAWRRAVGGKELGREALVLIEPELARGRQGTAQLLFLRAEVALQAERPEVALSSLEEIAQITAGEQSTGPEQGRLQLRRRALSLVEAQSAQLRGTDPRWQQVEQALRSSPSPGAAGEAAQLPREGPLAPPPEQG